MQFSDYIVYVDESGDHSLESIDLQFPVFVLVFCIFNKTEYAHQIAPSMQKFKFKHFGHDAVILHEHEIRKAKNSFTMLNNESKRQNFMTDLSQLIDASPFTIISVVVQKKLLKDKYTMPTNPYHIAMSYGLERVCGFLKNRQQHLNTTHIVFECRGKKEDNDLELEFRRARDENVFYGELPFEIIFADKRTNSCGLQIADLVARPIGRHALDPFQNNRAYSLIEKKLYRNDKGKIEGWGLKCFP